MNVEFLQPAATELYEAIVYYNIQRQDLGLEFAKEVTRYNRTDQTRS
jgi:hypothetical protein